MTVGSSTPCALRCSLRGMRMTAFNATVTKPGLIPDRRPRTLMRSWQVTSFDPTIQNGFELNDVAVPTITRPTDVLVNVSAGSVNPIDCRMKAGYGNEYLTVLRQLESCSTSRSRRLPMTLGRDVCGTVASVGQGVKGFRVGDVVFGSVAPQHQGSLAEYCIVPESQLSTQPSNLTAAEAACFPYVANTVWSALLLARINDKNAKNHSILIHGITGGIGSFAAQLLSNAWGARVIGTGTKDERALKVLQTMGIDPEDVVDRSEVDAFERLCDKGPYDFVLDPISSSFTRKTRNLLGIWRNSVYITLSSPLLADGDAFGFPFGFAKSGVDFASRFAKSLLSGGRWYGWAFYAPHAGLMHQIRSHIEAGKIKPIIDEVFDYEALPAALEKVSSGHGRGKTIIRISEK